MMRKGKAAVFSIILMVEFALSAATSAYAADQRTPEQHRGLSAKEIRVIPAEEVNRIEFQAPDNIRGEIRIRTDIDATEVKIEIDKKVSNLPAGERSAGILESITIETNVAEGRLLVVVKTPRDAEWEGSPIGVRVDLEILLPPGWVFCGKSKNYDFDINGPFREVFITGTYGKIRVEEVTDVADLRTEYGDLSLVAARGKVVINNRYGTATLADITVGEAPLRIRSEHGTATLRRIDGPVDISVDDAAVEITAWTLKTGSAKIATRNSPMIVDLVKWGAPELSLENKNAEIQISTPHEFSAIIRLEVSREGKGYIRTRDLPVKATHLDRRMLEGVTGNGDGSMKVFIGGYGSITLRGPQPLIRQDKKGL